jgi:hypothetical protein
MPGRVEFPTEANPRAPFGTPEHQSRRSPFRLSRFDAQGTRSGLRRLCRARCQELDGFVDGLFGANDEIGLPERARNALNSLAETRSILLGSLDVLDRESAVPDRQSEVVELARNLQKLTLAAEAQINEVILACTKPGREVLANMTSVAKPTIH